MPYWRSHILHSSFALLHAGFFFFVWIAKTNTRLAKLSGDYNLLSLGLQFLVVNFHILADNWVNLGFQLRSLTSPDEISHSDDILRIFVMACEVKNVKLSVIGLSCLQKLISHDAIAPSALKEILSTLKEVSLRNCSNMFLDFNACWITWLL